MEDRNKSNTPWWQNGLQLFLRLSAWIGGPVIIAVFVGKYLDSKFHSEPWLFLLSVGAAFVVSMVMLIRIGRNEMSGDEKETRSKRQ